MLRIVECWTWIKSPPYDGLRNSRTKLRIHGSQWGASSTKDMGRWVRGKLEQSIACSCFFPSHRSCTVDWCWRTSLLHQRAGNGRSTHARNSNTISSRCRRRPDQARRCTPLVGSPPGRTSRGSTRTWRVCWAVVWSVDLRRCFSDETRFQTWSA